MKKSLLTIVLAFSFVLGGAALAPTVSEAHGYVASPGSRAFFGSSAGGNLNTKLVVHNGNLKVSKRPKIRLLLVN